MTTPPAEKPRYTRAGLAAMSQEQLAANADDIHAALRENRIDFNAGPKPVPTEPHPSGKEWVMRSYLDSLTTEQMAERLDSVREALREDRVFDDRH